MESGDGQRKSYGDGVRREPVLKGSEREAHKKLCGSEMEDAAYRFLYLAFTRGGHPLINGSDGAARGGMSTICLNLFVVRGFKEGSDTSKPMRAHR